MYQRIKFQRCLILVEKCDICCWDGKLPCILRDLCTLLKDIKKKKSKIYVVYGCGRVADLVCYIVKLQLLTKISKHKVRSTVDLPILFAWEKTCFSPRASEVFWKFGTFCAKMLMSISRSFPFIFPWGNESFAVTHSLNVGSEMQMITSKSVVQL